MVEEIKVKNRYGYYHKFIKVNDNHYKFIPDSYMRIIYESSDNTKIKAIDPDGGPWLNRGTMIDNYVIDDIVIDDKLLLFKFNKLNKYESDLQ